MFKLAVVVLAVALAQVLAAPTPISPSLQHSLKTKGTVNIMVTMREKTFPVLKQLKLKTFVNREARLNQVASSLKSLAATSQQSVLAYLANKENIKVKSLWVSNKISIKGADAELIQSLAGMEEVDSIREDEVIPRHVPVSSSKVYAPKALQWGVELIGAPEVWAQGYTGAGVVVATIDTGVRYTHKNLFRNFRQDYGWFDPYTGSSTPKDSAGHGTHTMGTIAGSDGIGVAPDAQWIACMGCDLFGCEISTLEECGQFMVCPTLPDGTMEDCTKAPHLVSNSWGGGGGQDFYDAVIAAWDAAGIIPLFSNGNSGSSCYSAGSPADSLNTPVIAVGATDEFEELAYFSSIGPSVYETIKPDISAPGVDVISSSSSGDEEFESMSGTSMACPHVAGVVALLLSNGTSLNYATLSQHLYDGATHTIAETGADCGDIPESQYPNNHVGYGRLSATASLDSLLASRKH